MNHLISYLEQSGRLRTNSFNRVPHPVRSMVQVIPVLITALKDERLTVAMTAELYSG